MEEQRKQLQIKISLKADAEIEAARKDFGMSKIELVSRVCEWFARQDRLDKLNILNGLAADDDILELLYKRRVKHRKT